MKLFLDTNIIVDVISKRNGYKDSLRILKCCEANIFKGYVSANTVTNVMYILRKHVAPNVVRSAVQALLTIVEVATVLKSDITTAFDNGIKDYEDAVQAACAARINADCIVTRNIKDFKGSDVPAVLPAKALELL
jgi:predicted nucleic acid-binding protein